MQDQSKQPEEQTWHGPNGWTLVADRRQVFPDDPGQGTPLLVHTPLGSGTGTLHRVLDTAEVDAGAGTLPVPSHIINWLDGIAEQAETWVFQ